LYIPLGTTRITVGHDAAADNLTIFTEFLGEHVLINSPGNVADEQVLAGTRINSTVGLGLLRGWWGFGLSLAFLGGSLGGRFGVGGIRV
jgi:hypothetical protein